MPFKSIKDLTVKDKLRVEKDFNKRANIPCLPPGLRRPDDFYMVVPDSELDSEVDTDGKYFERWQLLTSGVILIIVEVEGSKGLEDAGAPSSSMKTSTPSKRALRPRTSSARVLSLDGQPVQKIKCDRHLRDIIIQGYYTGQIISCTPYIYTYTISNLLFLIDLDFEKKKNPRI